MLSSRTQLITQNSGPQALPSKELAKNQCVINSVQLLSYIMYSTNGGKTIVSASEALMEVGDGVGF